MEYTERAASEMNGKRDYTTLRHESNFILYWCVYVCLRPLVHFIHHDTQIIKAEMIETVLLRNIDIRIWWSMNDITSFML